MAIIYSYPVNTTPQTVDLLLGTSIAEGNATKSYSIASLVGFINAQAGTGTVTSVATTSSDFINVQGGTILTNGTITASLSAGGTPSATTFLRGDNNWAPASTTGNPNVEILDEGISLTDAVNSINFTGAGVTTENIGSAVTVRVQPVNNTTLSINGGNGITVNQTIGDVIVTNSGVLSLLPGSNINLVNNNGIYTINATNNPGTVQSVLAGSGLVLESATETITTNPTIGIQYTGSNNYILVGQNTDTITNNDIIAFNKLSSSDVKTTNLGTIPISAVPQIQTYINTGDANVVKNNTDLFTNTAIVENIVTSLVSEYPATPDINTLYILIPDVDACVPQTMTLAQTTTNILDGSGGVAPGAQYTITNSSATYEACPGETWSFTTTITPAAGYYFSVAPSPLNISGIIPAAGTTANQTLTGTILPIPTPTITATLLVVYNIQGGPNPLVTSGTDDTGATQSTSSAVSLNYSFNTIVDQPSGYTWTSGPTYGTQTGTITGSQTVVTTVTGTLQLT